MKKDEIKELLKKMNEIIKEMVDTQFYGRNSELGKIAHQIQAAKLKDEFFRADLTDDEQKLLDTALILANVSK